KSSESHSKAEIKFVIKNEYAQIIPAIKAVKTAKQNLSKAKRCLFSIPTRSSPTTSTTPRPSSQT
ncbi:hypothetical protein BSPWISOXPB_9979, partial [uncultured Gammaproteobacteria bacterium]